MKGKMYYTHDDGLDEVDSRVDGLDDRGEALPRSSLVNLRLKKEKKKTFYQKHQAMFVCFSNLESIDNRLWRVFHLHKSDTRVRVRIVSSERKLRSDLILHCDSEKVVQLRIAALQLIDFGLNELIVHNAALQLADQETNISRTNRLRPNHQIRSSSFETLSLYLLGDIGVVDAWRSQFDLAHLFGLQVDGDANKVVRNLLSGRLLSHADQQMISSVLHNLDTTKF